MNRAAAFELLQAHLKVRESELFEAKESQGRDARRTDAFDASGKRYKIESRVVEIGSMKLRVEGSIHDGNSQKFQLLEESLEVSL